MNWKNEVPVRYLLLVGILIILFECKTAGQPYYFRHYQVENGLSNNSVFCSAQDKNGFLWFGTKDGLNRFDGYRFKKYSIQDEGSNLVPDFINCLYTDNKGVLWIGSQKGLYTFDSQRECLVRYIDSVTEINSILTDQHHQLWFISRFTLCRYNFNSKTLRVFTPAKYFDATSICLSDDGVIWVSSATGLLMRFNDSSETFTGYDLFSHSKPSSSHWIQKIYAAGNGSLFVGTSGQGLKQFNISTAEYTDLLTLNPDKTTVFIRDIKQYSSNEFWFASESGIFILDTRTKKFFNVKKKFLDPYSLTDNAVYTLCRDKEGGIWAGTYFGGINYYSKQYAAFQKYFPDNLKGSISGSAVREICEDHLGNIWIGTEDAGLNKLNTKTGNITPYNPTGETGSIAYSNIHGLLAVGNNLWIGTFEHGLDIMDIRTGNVKIHFSAGPGTKDLKSNFIVSFLQTRSGEIFVGTSNSICRYDHQANGFDPVTEMPSGIFVSCMLEDHNGTIWIGTHDRGIYYFNTATKQRGHFENNPSNNKSLTTNTINAIYEDSKQNIWFATEGGGLCKLGRDRKAFAGFTTGNGLPSNFIFKVLEDNKNTLWISTSRGLVNMRPEDKAITVYTKDNGLLNNQFNYNSGCKDATGKIYFGSVKGMITLKPVDFLKTSVEAPLYITGFQVQNKELEISKDSFALRESIIYTNHITLPYNRSSFSIDFAALSYISPEMTVYNYKMDRLDKEWTEIKPNRKIYFTNLSPGTYILKLKAAINGNLSKKEKQLIIKILPPVWATYWAYLLYAVIVIALCYYLLRSYHIIVQDKKEKEIYEAKIDFFTNIAHEIRTPLTLIKGPVDNLLEMVDDVPEMKDDVVTMERNTDRLIALISQILDFRQTETKGFSIDFTKLNISELLKEEYQTFSVLARKKKLDYNINLPSTDTYACADEEALRKILSNLFNNAIKYAGKKVDIRLLPYNNEADNFLIEFENDGLIIPAEMKEKIFEPFYRLKESSKQQGTGIGLALARSLTELHMGRLYLKDASPDLNVFVLCLPFKPVRNDRKRRNKRPIKLK